MNSIGNQPCTSKTVHNNACKNFQPHLKRKFIGKQEQYTEIVDHRHARILQKCGAHSPNRREKKKRLYCQSVFTLAYCR